MKRLAICLIVGSVVIAIFVLTRGSIRAGQAPLVWLLIGMGFFIAAFFFRRQKPK